MAHSDRATTDVDLLIRKAKVIDREDSLAGERLVDLKEVDIILGDASLRKDLRDCECRADSVNRVNTISHAVSKDVPHDLGWDTNDGRCGEFADDGETEPLRHRATRKKHRSSTVRNLGGVTCVGRAILRKRGLELAQALECNAFTDTIVAVHDNLLLLLSLRINALRRDWDDLSGKLARLLCRGGFAERLSGEFVLGGTGDFELRGDVFGGDTHGDEAVLGLLVRENLLRERFGLRRGPVAVSHRLDTSTYNKASTFVKGMYV